MNFFTVKWIAVCVSVGITLGLAGFTFIYARGHSYLTNDPSACANCHVMNEYYDGWLKSSHHTVAVCNDCHTQPGIINKYLTKAENGFWHSWAFTTGKFHDPIQIKPRNIKVTEDACRKCHSEITSAIEHGGAGKTERLSCIKCHNKVGHF